VIALRSKTVLFVYVLLSLVVGVYEAVAFGHGRQTSLQFEFTWSVVALLLVISWLELDCREHKEIYRPFEFGFLLLVFWVFYLPYYLFRTRGAYAVLWLGGFIGLSFLGWALEWLVYVAR
jgi:hypothetical protein